MATLFINALIIIVTLLTLLWIISVFIKNVSIIDLFWGIGFVIINAYYFYNSGPLHLRKIILLVLVSIWGLRLTVHLCIRNLGKAEDFRYQEFRKQFGPKRYWWFSFFQVFLLQGALIVIVSLPLLGVQTQTSTNELNGLDYIAVLVWLVGILFETIGDYQLSKFKKDPSNKGKVLNSGLWRYTRHPNYFGDAAVWWSFGLFSLASGGYWHILGSVLMTYLIIKVSGVALLEKTLKSKPKYEDYIKKTSAFFPWFPKK